jgi:hypothetical protein
LTVSNVSAALLQTVCSFEEIPWLFSIWSWAIPLKINFFTWLSIKDIPLTWEALQKRGWQGPGRCPLCNLATENLNHLLIHCRFTVSVWNSCLHLLSLTFNWKGDSVSKCFAAWHSNKLAPDSLAALTCWSIWLERNQVLFEGRPPSCQAVVHKILTSFKWQPSSQKLLQPKVCDFQLTEGTTLICFDGAALSNGLCCGAGGTLRATQTRTTNWFLNCGAGTNNKAELLGLWVSLTLAKFWNLNHILVLGDSKLIIDWINHSCKFNSVHLEGWKQKTLSLSTYFSDIHFSHIPRTLNRLLTLYLRGR